MDHQFQTRKVDAPCRHVGGNTHPRPPVPQRLQRVGPLRLRQLARQSHNLKTPVAHSRHQVVHVHPGFAEHDGGLRLVIAQRIEDCVFTVAHGH